jgi:G:T-mismatch repair DNA endonuclease (very short patch repair protein)
VADTLSPEKRSELMSLVRNKDTRPEMVVRRLVYGLGYIVFQINKLTYMARRLCLPQYVIFSSRR